MKSMKELQYKLTVIMAAALVAAGTAVGAERVERSLGEGVRGWISMERPQMTARDAIVDRLDFARFGILLAEGTGAEDVKFDFHLLRGDESKIVADWKVADGFLLVDVSDTAKDGTRYLLDAGKSKVSFVVAAAREDTRPADTAVSLEAPCRWPDDDWAGRQRHIAVVNPPIPYEPGTVVSLRGEWDFLFRRNDDSARIHSFNKLDRWPGERKIVIPGCWEAQGIGESPDKRIAIGYPGRSPMPLRHVANGSGWYRRRVKIPTEWAGKRIWLKTGGVRGRGRFWVNDVPVARLDDYIGTWKYDITGIVRPGEDAKVVVEASNYFPTRNSLLDIAARWGGIWRDIELEATPKDVWMDDVYVRGDVSTMKPDVKVTLGGDTNGVRVVVQIPDEIKPWSPEHPNLYTARVDLVSADGAVLQTWRERFGIRSIEAKGSKFYMNGRQFYVRGFGDDAMYPLTGLTPADRDFHRSHLASARKAGFNFVRLHTHTEIDEYFQAADETGVLVQPELSYNADECQGFFSFDACRDAYEMHLQLRRHPSFAVYSGGNEGWLGENADRKLYRFIKGIDKDRLVINHDGGRDNTYGTSDHKSGPLAIWERGAYEPGMPFIAHEYLNLTVKSDPRIEGDYTAVYGPPATMTARTAWLRGCGLGAEWVDLLQNAQHSLQAFWQKYGIEQARLDPFCDGYCLWLLADYIGAPQDGVTCTANGVLDAFWRPKKGGWSLDDFAKFNSPVGVFAFTGKDDEAFPSALSWNRCLFDWPDDECYRYADRERFVYVAGEKIPVSFHLDNYGGGDICDAFLEWRFKEMAGRRKLGTVAFGGIRQLFATEIAVPEVVEAGRFTLSFSVGGKVDGKPFRAENSRDFWVFPRRQTRHFNGVAVVESLHDALAKRYDGLCGFDALNRHVLHGLTNGIVKVAIVEAGSREEMAATRAKVHVISLSNQRGRPNNKLGWWFTKDQVGVAFKPHAFLKNLPYEPMLTPLLFRIIKTPTKLPIEGLAPEEIIAAGEGADYVGLYLADSRTVAGMRHVHVSGLDLLSNTPEGTMLLDGILEELTDHL